MDTPTNTADVLDDAKQLLSNYMAGKSIGGTIDGDRQSTVVIASMLAAIAVEIRRQTNLMAEIAYGPEVSRD